MVRGSNRSLTEKKIWSRRSEEYNGRLVKKQGLRVSRKSEVVVSDSPRNRRRPPWWTMPVHDRIAREHRCGEQDGRVNGIAIGRWDWKAEKIQGWNRDESSESKDWNNSPRNAKVQEVVDESRYALSEICVVELGGKLGTDSGDRERAGMES